MDFWQIYDKLNFVITLIIAEGVLCSRFQRRKYFLPRAALGILVPVMVSFFWPAVINVWVAGFKYFAVFLITLCMLVFCFKSDVWSCLYGGIVAYCAQHISYQATSIITTLSGGSVPRWGELLILCALCAAVYVTLYFIFVRRLKKGENFIIYNKAQVVISSIVLSITVYISFFGAVYSIKNDLPVLLIVICLFSIFSCVLGILLEFSLFTMKKGETELAIVKHMLHQAKQQYVETKENIDIINIKCHDLRHQLSTLHGKIDEDELSRISEAVNIYDGNFKTGNDALDVVLTENGLRCREKGVRLTCLMDGAVLNKMKQSDIYSLFGNAIENALESVQGLDNGRKVISISEIKRDKLVNIRIENYYDGTIVFEDGLPVTRKDKNYHGFGMKSMKLIAEKYGGQIGASINGDIFRLDIFLLAA